MIEVGLSLRSLFRLSGWLWLDSLALLFALLRFRVWSQPFLAGTAITITPTRPSAYSLHHSFTQLLSSDGRETFAHTIVG